MGGIPPAEPSQFRSDIFKQTPPFRRSRNALSESLMSESKGWSCYILECTAHSYYVGVPTDVRHRVHGSAREGLEDFLGPEPKGELKKTDA